jgi:polo-like kinase 4
LLQLSPSFDSTSSNAKRIDVLPLNTIRLQPTRHKTKNAILSILEEPPGEVAIEFIKYKGKYGEGRIQDVCRISNDGLRIVLYQPFGKGVKVMEQPPPLPHNGADHIYSYDNLPEKHWKKYKYAHRFVQMVRAKTPKVTFYSELAKCQLMETLDDFEMSYYKGGKVMKNGGSRDFKSELSSNMIAQEQNIIQHAEVCLQHCMNIEQTLSMMKTSLTIFPVIIGRRPVDQQQEMLKEVRYENNTFNNYISSSQTPIRAPKITMPSFSMDQTPSPSVKVTLSNRVMTDNSNTSLMTNYQRKFNIAGVENAIHLPNGTVEIQYHDGTQISVLTTEQGGGIRFTASRTKNSMPIHYNENDLMPEIVRMKFKQLPVVLKQLMEQDIAFITSTPNQNHHQSSSSMSSAPFFSNRINNMRFIR